jgi:membrane protease YdiL (CAAX protease family)
MSAGLRKALTQIAFPGVTILLVSVISAVDQLSPAEDLRLVWPSSRQTAIWLPLWFLWMAATEWLSARLGLPRSQRWESAERAVVAVRTVNLGVIAPIAEELMFRGLLFERFTEIGLRPPSLVTVSAAAFAIVHIQYGPKQGALIFLDGIMFGSARLTSGSVVLPMFMHVIGNLVAIYQRLPARLPYQGLIRR